MVYDKSLDLWSDPEIWESPANLYGSRPNISVDINNNVYIAYPSSGIHLLTNASGDWVDEIIDTGSHPVFINAVYPVIGEQHINIPESYMLSYRSDSNLLFTQVDSDIGSGCEINRGVTIGNDAQIGEDVIINKDSIIGDNAEIGDGTIINRNVTIGDNTVIGSYVTIGRNVTIGSDVQIGDNVFINQGVNIGNNVDIGSEVTIGRDAAISDGVVIPDGTVIEKGEIVSP